MCDCGPKPMKPAGKPKNGGPKKPPAKPKKAAKKK
jgi:hypothetical protein